jgi:hypothetical protein
MLHALAVRDFGVSQQNHCVAYALETGYAISPQLWMLNHCNRLADSIISVDDYRHSHRSTPIACRTEALLCNLRMHKRSSNPSRCERARVLAVVSDNLDLQIRDRLYDGSFRGGRDDKTVRIDYLQRNLSSFSGYYTLLTS